MFLNAMVWSNEQGLQFWWHPGSRSISRNPKGSTVDCCYSTLVHWRLKILNTDHDWNPGMSNNGFCSLSTSSSQQCKIHTQQCMCSSLHKVAQCVCQWWCASVWCHPCPCSVTAGSELEWYKMMTHCILERHSQTASTGMAETVYMFVQTQQWECRFAAEIA